MKGIKHTVTCRCILPQFLKVNPPRFHQFIVFSVINDDETVKVKYAQCNNCGIIHKVIDICKSEIINGNEHMKSIPTIDEIKCSIEPSIIAVLETNHADLPTYEHVKFIMESQLWGEHVVLSRDIEGDDIIIKYVRILGQKLFNVDTEIVSMISG